MRMRDLADAAQLPRTTIHHYLREGLLPEPDRTAANAATYGPEHLDRLRLLKALRGPELGPLSVSEIRRVLPLVEEGLSPSEAVGLASLKRRGLAAMGRKGENAAPADTALGLKDVARRLEREPRQLRQLLDAGLIEPGTGSGGGGFDAADVAAADSCLRLNDLGIETRHLEPLVELTREMRNYEQVLENLVCDALGDESVEPVRGELRTAFRELHLYLLTRLAR
ncbi:MAG: MerR family transcriptional regulator [Gemmatimonadota bacterium]|jgi:DNA-binding transcriptional MerR regulator